MGRANAPDRRRSEPEFELTGGALCLDLVNTVKNRPGESRDLLESPVDLIAWAEHAGLLDASEARGLRARARGRPLEAHRALTAARTLREQMFELLHDAARGGGPGSDEALDPLNERVAEALGSLRIVPSDHGYRYDWSPRLEGFDRVLAAVARSAGSLLTSKDLARVRVCAADRCDWLFLDFSRNQARRWCDMKVCGNRAKARRHYQRARRTRGSKRRGRGRA